MDFKQPNNEATPGVNKKAIIIASVIAGVLLVAGVSYGVYYKMNNTSKQAKNEATNINNSQVSPSTDTKINKTSDTSNWQTYTSIKFGYSIKYPGNYQVSSYNNENDIYIEKIKNKEKGVVVKVKDLVSLDDFIKEYEADDQGINKIVKQEDYLLNGVSAKKLTGQIALGVDDNIVFANRNDKTYTINFLGYLSLGESNEHLDIISTFKFRTVSKGTLMIYDPKAAVSELKNGGFEPLVWYLVDKDTKWEEAVKSAKLNTKLKFSEQSKCKVDNNGIVREEGCLEGKEVRWGYGDRVRIIGENTGGVLNVDVMEIVSSSPVSEW